MDDYLADLPAAIPTVDFGRVRSAGALPDTDAIVMLGHYYTVEIAALIREKGRRLRWIQLTTAGYDGIECHRVTAALTEGTGGAIAGWKGAAGR